MFIIYLPVPFLPLVLPCQCLTAMNYLTFYVQHLVGEKCYTNIVNASVDWNQLHPLSDFIQIH